MLTFISYALHLFCVFLYHAVARVLAPMCFWRKVPKSRRLSYSDYGTEERRI